VIGKPDREAPIVVISWETFAALYAAANGIAVGAIEEAIEENGEASS
jgi:hypothetical protein